MGHYSSHYWENPYDSGIPRSDRRSGDYRAYTPTALAGMRLAISPAVDAEVAAAERAVRSLNRGSHGDLGLVSRFLLRSEAIASSYIEGITPSPRNVALAELALDEDVRGLTETAQQVARNMTIVRAASDALSTKDALTIGDLETLQSSLITDPPDLQGVRTTQNWIGVRATTPSTRRMYRLLRSRCGACSRTSCCTWPAPLIPRSCRPHWSTRSSRRSTPSPTGTAVWAAH